MQYQLSLDAAGSQVLSLLPLPNTAPQAGTKHSLPALSSPQISLGASSLSRARIRQQVSTKAKQHISCPAPYPQASPPTDLIQPLRWGDFIGMLCAIQISTAWYAFSKGVGKERHGRETEGGGGSGKKKKATLWEFEGISITEVPESTGQGMKHNVSWWVSGCAYPTAAQEQWLEQHSFDHKDATLAEKWEYIRWTPCCCPTTRQGSDTVLTLRKLV